MCTDGHNVSTLSTSGRCQRLMRINVCVYDHTHTRTHAHTHARTHARTDRVERALLLDVVVTDGTAVLELLARDDEPVQVGGNAHLVLDLGLDMLNGVAGLDFKGDGLV